MSSALGKIDPTRIALNLRSRQAEQNITRESQRLNTLTEQARKEEEKRLKEEQERFQKEQEAKKTEQASRLFTKGKDISKYEQGEKSGRQVIEHRVKNVVQAGNIEDAIGYAEGLIEYAKSRGELTSFYGADFESLDEAGKLERVINTSIQNDENYQAWLSRRRENLRDTSSMAFRLEYRKQFGVDPVDVKVQDSRGREVSLASLGEIGLTPEEAGKAVAEYEKAKEEAKIAQDKAIKEQIKTQMDSFIEQSKAQGIIPRDVRGTYDEKTGLITIKGKNFSQTLEAQKNPTKFYTDQDWANLQFTGDQTALQKVRYDAIKNLSKTTKGTITPVAINKEMSRLLETTYKEGIPVSQPAADFNQAFKQLSDQSNAVAKANQALERAVQGDFSLRLTSDERKALGKEGLQNFNRELNKIREARANQQKYAYFNPDPANPWNIQKIEKVAGTETPDPLNPWNVQPIGGNIELDLPGGFRQKFTYNPKTERIDVEDVNMTVKQVEIPKGGRVEGLTEYLWNLPKGIANLASEYGLTGPVAGLSGIKTKYSNLPTQFEVEGGALHVGIRSGLEGATTGKFDQSSREWEEYQQKVLGNPEYAEGSLLGSALFAGATFGIGPFLRGLTTSGRVVKEASALKAITKGQEEINAFKISKQGNEIPLAKINDWLYVQPKQINLGTKANPYYLKFGKFTSPDILATESIVVDVKSGTLSKVFPKLTQEEKLSLVGQSQSAELKISKGLGKGELAGVDLADRYLNIPRGFYDLYGEGITSWIQKQRTIPKSTLNAEEKALIESSRELGFVEDVTKIRQIPSGDIFDYERIVRLNPDLFGGLAGFAIPSRGVRAFEIGKVTEAQQAYRLTNFGGKKTPADTEVYNVLDYGLEDVQTWARNINKRNKQIVQAQKALEEMGEIGKAKTPFPVPKPEIKSAKVPKSVEKYADIYQGMSPEQALKAFQDDYAIRAFGRKKVQQDLARQIYNEYVAKGDPIPNLIQMLKPFSTIPVKVQPKQEKKKEEKKEGEYREVKTDSGLVTLQKIELQSKSKQKEQQREKLEEELAQLISQPVNFGLYGETGFERLQTSKRIQELQKQLRQITDLGVKQIQGQDYKRLQKSLEQQGFKYDFQQGFKFDFERALKFDQMFKFDRITEQALEFKFETPQITVPQLDVPKLPPPPPPKPDLPKEKGRRRRTSRKITRQLREFATPNELYLAYGPRAYNLIGYQSEKGVVYGKHGEVKKTIKTKGSRKVTKTIVGGYDLSKFRW